MEGVKWPPPEAISSKGLREIHHTTTVCSRFSVLLEKRCKSARRKESLPANIALHPIPCTHQTTILAKQDQPSASHPKPTKRR
ncbi:hypothetical protein ACOMHN_015234 [Nucella lapillus]